MQQPEYLAQTNSTGHEEGKADVSCKKRPQPELEERKADRTESEEVIPIFLCFAYPGVPIVLPRMVRLWLCPITCPFIVDTYCGPRGNIIAIA